MQSKKKNKHLFGWCIDQNHVGCVKEVDGGEEYPLSRHVKCQCNCHTQEEKMDINTQITEAVQSTNTASSEQKMNYPSEHAYLVEKGLAKPGKGRRSKAGHEAIQRAIESGITFGNS
jgi:hypothetical protein